MENNEYEIVLKEIMLMYEKVMADKMDGTIDLDSFTIALIDILSTARTYVSKIEILKETK